MLIRPIHSIGHNGTGQTTAPLLAASPRPTLFDRFINAIDLGLHRVLLRPAVAGAGPHFLSLMATGNGPSQGDTSKPRGGTIQARGSDGEDYIITTVTPDDDKEVIRLHLAFFVTARLQKGESRAGYRAMDAELVLEFEQEDRDAVRTLLFHLPPQAAEQLGLQFDDNGVYLEDPRAMVRISQHLPRTLAPESAVPALSLLKTHYQLFSPQAKIGSIIQINLKRVDPYIQFDPVLEPRFKAHHTYATLKPEGLLIWVSPSIYATPSYSGGRPCLWYQTRTGWHPLDPGEGRLLREEDLFAFGMRDSRPRASAGPPQQTLFFRVGTDGRSIWPINVSDK